MALTLAQTTAKTNKTYTRTERVRRQGLKTSKSHEQQQQQQQARGFPAHKPKRAASH